MKNFTPDMIEKAKAAKSAEELLALAKANNIEMTEEEAKTYFEQMNPKTAELSDDELDNVSGGVELLRTSSPKPSYNVKDELSDNELDNMSNGTILKPIITDTDGEVLF